jgi:hypothetical protein
MERRAAIFYLHPWEIDPQQPRISSSWASRFRHYRNLGKTEERLKRLLSEFSFGPLRDVLGCAREDDAVMRASGSPN